MVNLKTHHTVWLHYNYYNIMLFLRNMRQNKISIGLMDGLTDGHVDGGTDRGKTVYPNFFENGVN